MARQSRRSRYSKMRTNKQKGGGWLDDIKAHANNAVAKTQELANHPKAQAAKQSAVDAANKTQGMITSAHSTISASGQAAYAAAKPHLDTAQMHAQDAATHASNSNYKGFKQSMKDATTSLGQAHNDSQAAVLAQKPSNVMTVNDHIESLQGKAAKTATNLHGKAMKFLGLGSKSVPAPAAVPAAPAAAAPDAKPAMGGRRRKSRKHSKKGRRGHRMTKKRGMKRRSYKTRKGSNPKKMLKSRTKK